MGFTHRERTSHIHPLVRPVCRADRASLGSGSPVASPEVTSAASRVDEALAEIECQRELIKQLVHFGQPTGAAELALQSYLGEYAGLIDHEYSVRAKTLETNGTA